MIYLNDYRHLGDVKWHWPHFSPQELACRGSGELKIDETLLDRLERLRTRIGDRALAVSSAYRSPAYNNQVSKTGFDGPHTTGLAVDIAVSGTLAHDVLAAAMTLDFTGIGIQQKGAYSSRFIHLDLITPDRLKNRPWVWSY